MNRRDRQVVVAMRLAWLTALWVLLWGSLSWANVIGGLVVAGVVLAVFAGIDSERMVLRPLAALHFGIYFAYKLAESTYVVAREIVTPENNLRRAIIRVPLHSEGPGLATLVANAISLTPGTLTLEVTGGSGDDDPRTLYVHVLHLHDPESIRGDIYKLEALAVRAFGTADAVASLRERAS